MEVHYNGWSLNLKNEPRPLSGHLSPIHNYYRPAQHR